MQQQEEEEEIIEMKIDLEKTEVEEEEEEEVMNGGFFVCSVFFKNRIPTTGRGRGRIEQPRQSIAVQQEQIAKTVFADGVKPQVNNVDLDR